MWKGKSKKRRCKPLEWILQMYNDDATENAHHPDLSSLYALQSIYICPFIISSEESNFIICKSDCFTKKYIKLKGYKIKYNCVYGLIYFTVFFLNIWKCCLENTKNAFKHFFRWKKYKKKNTKETKFKSFSQFAWFSFF